MAAISIYWVITLTHLRNIYMVSSARIWLTGNAKCKAVDVNNVLPLNHTIIKASDIAASLSLALLIISKSRCLTWRMVCCCPHSQECIELLSLCSMYILVYCFKRCLLAINVDNSIFCEMYASSRPRGKLDHRSNSYHTPVRVILLSIC